MNQVNTKDRSPLLIQECSMFLLPALTEKTSPTWLPVSKSARLRGWSCLARVATSARIVNSARHLNSARHVNSASLPCTPGPARMACLVYTASLAEENVSIGNRKFWRVLDNSSPPVMVPPTCETKRTIIIYAQYDCCSSVAQKSGWITGPLFPTFVLWPRGLAACFQVHEP